MGIILEATNRNNLQITGKNLVNTLKTNMSLENQWLEDVFPTEIVPFLGDMLVFGGVNTLKLPTQDAIVTTRFMGFLVGNS